MFYVVKLCPELIEVLNYAPLKLKENLIYEEQMIHIVDIKDQKASDYFLCERSMEKPCQKGDYLANQRGRDINMHICLRIEICIKFHEEISLEGVIDGPK